MSIPLWCLVIAAVLPMVAKAPVAYFMARAEGGYDNKQPRRQQGALAGAGARAVAGHHNAFEALIVFAPGVLVAEASGGDADVAAGLALFWVASRLVYHALYIADVSTARSLVWTFGWTCAIALYLTPLL